MATLWSIEDCERLIEEIHKYEVIWKSNHRDYGKHGPHLVAWKKIALALDFTTYNTVHFPQISLVGQSVGQSVIIIMPHGHGPLRPK